LNHAAILYLLRNVLSYGSFLFSMFFRFLYSAYMHLLPCERYTLFYMKRGLGGSHRLMTSADMYLGQHMYG